MNIAIRQAQQDDLETLWQFLAIAGYEPDAQAAKAVPVVASHLTGWKREGDFGVMAERNGIAVGAAWARQFELSEGPVYFAGPNVPEISIGVLASERGTGIGERLLAALIVAAKANGCDGLCLTVRDTNPAKRLYDRVGFLAVEGAAVPNRVGGLSLGMVLLFSARD